MTKLIHNTIIDNSRGLSVRWGVVLQSLDEWFVPRQAGDDAIKIIPKGSIDVAGGMRSRFTQEGIFDMNIPCLGITELFEPFFDRWLSGFLPSLSFIRLDTAFQMRLSSCETSHVYTCSRKKQKIHSHKAECTIVSSCCWLITLLNLVSLRLVGVPF